MEDANSLLGQLAPIAYEYVLRDLLRASPESIDRLCEAVFGADFEMVQDHAHIIALLWDKCVGDKLIKEASRIAKRSFIEDLTSDEVVNLYSDAIRKCGEVEGMESCIEALLKDVPFDDICA